MLNKRGEAIKDITIKESEAAITANKETTSFGIEAMVAPNGNVLYWFSN